MLTYPANLPGLAYSVIRRPKHSVSVQTHQSGAEVRTSYWSEPLWEWDLTYELLRDGFRNDRNYTELKQIEGLFLACTGSLNPFAFKDPDDHAVTRTGIGTTDGVSVYFDLTRYYGTQALVGQEHIGILDTTQPFNLYIDNSPTPVSVSDPVYGYTLALGTACKQAVAFNSAPPAGHAVTVDMSYLFYVRFQADSLDFEKFMAGLWSLKKVTLASLRGGGGASSYSTPQNTVPGRSLNVSSSPLILLPTDGYVGVTNATGAPLEIDLPAAPILWQTIRLADEGANAGTYNWTIKYLGTTIDTVVINSGFTSLRWNGTAWIRVGP